MTEDPTKATRATIVRKLYVSALVLASIWGVGYLLWVYFSASISPNESRPQVFLHEITRPGGWLAVLYVVVVNAFGPFLVLAGINGWLRWLRRP